jgi:glycerol-3-phosphate acyltransferase PlsY
MFILWLVVSYLCGALPWSVWLGKLFFRADPRQHADGNPGAANAFRAAGWRLGAAVLVLDYLKAFVPVLIAHYGFQFPDEQLFWVALMPTIGHAFSIFLRFRGGRAIVVMFGVWSGLTLYVVPVALGVTAIAAVVLFRSDILRTLVIPVVLVCYLVVQNAPLWMILLATAQLLVFAVKIGVAQLFPAPLQVS